MCTLRASLFVALGVGMSVSVSYAGPCSPLSRARSP
jgi:hypothetical protein